MSVERRSFASSGGPTGSASLRLALLALLALVAALTLGADAARPQEPDPTVVSANEAGPVEEPELAPPEPSSGDPVPVEIDPGPSASSGEAAPAPPPEEVQEQAPPQTPDAPPAGPTVVAENQSSVWQVIWQVQEGCQSHCYGTQQQQNASQSAKTTQEASAVSDGESGSGNAVAVNRSSTVQFVWQMQLGCVAFCFDTVQSQSATQTAQTTQTASSWADFVASAVNVAETVQYVWQHQQGCEVECHGVSASQTQSQTQGTTQSATAVGGSGSGWDVAMTAGFLDSLVALAKNFGATVEMIFQHQLADCRQHCVGGSQTQDAAQRADVSQVASARDGAAEPVAEPPPAPAPTEQGPAEQAPAPTPEPERGGSGSAPVAIGAAVGAGDPAGETDRGWSAAPGFTGRGRPPRDAAPTQPPSGTSNPAAPTAGTDGPAANAPSTGAPASTRAGHGAASRDASPTDASPTATSDATPPASPGYTPTAAVPGDDSAAPSPVWRPVAGTLGALMLLTAIPALRRASRRSRPATTGP